MNTSDNHTDEGTEHKLPHQRDFEGCFVTYFSLLKLQNLPLPIFICNQHLTLSLATSDLFCWEGHWLRAFSSVKLTHCLYKQTGCSSFPSTAGLCHSHSHLPIALPKRQRRENRKGGMLSRQSRVRNQHLPGKITEQKGLNKTPQGSCRCRRPWSSLTAVTE